MVSPIYPPELAEILRRRLANVGMAPDMGRAIPPPVESVQQVEGRGGFAGEDYKIATGNQESLMSQIQAKLNGTQKPPAPVPSGEEYKPGGVKKKPKVHSPTDGALLPMIIGGILSYLAGGSDRGASTAQFANSFLQTRKLGTDAQNQSEQLARDEEEQGKKDALDALKMAYDQEGGKAASAAKIMAILKEHELRQKELLSDREFKRTESAKDREFELRKIDLKGSPLIQGLSKKAGETPEGRAWILAGSPTTGPIAEAFVQAQTAKDKLDLANAQFVSGPKTNSMNATADLTAGKAFAQNWFNKNLPAKTERDRREQEAKIAALESLPAYRQGMLSQGAERIAIATYLANSLTGDRNWDNTSKLWGAKIKLKSDPLIAEQKANNATLLKLNQKMSAPPDPLAAMLYTPEQLQATRQAELQQKQMLEARNAAIDAELTRLSESFVPPQPQAPNGGPLRGKVGSRRTVDTSGGAGAFAPVNPTPPKGIEIVPEKKPQEYQDRPASRGPIPMSKKDPVKKSTTKKAEPKKTKKTTYVTIGGKRIAVEEN